MLNFYHSTGFGLDPKRAAKKETTALQATKKPTSYLVGFNSAERVGFEPTDLLQSTVFKTAAFDHSAISPIKRIRFLNAVANIRTFFCFTKTIFIKITAILRAIF